MEKKMYAVTYVGLSKDEYDANGFCDVKVFTTFGKAAEYKQELIDRETEECLEKGIAWTVGINEDDEFRMEWAGGDEQLRIEIHAVDVD